ncbi:MAG TPA: MBL fold metallo-hydrolase [Gemmatimonadaceae bacterium]|nr:MBL fold metallo-hydrolase [Gemmatimonadaceae bacterium]
MRRWALAGLALLLGGSAIAARRGPAFTVERLADGVYAVLRREPLGLGGDPNNLFVVRDSDVVVVDAHFSPGATREVIAAIRGVTRKPVRWVINTHWHDDHVTGNAAYREAYPGVRFVAHDGMRRDLLGQGAENRERFIASAPRTAAFLRELVATRRTVEGKTASDGERRAYERYADLIERFAREAPTAAIVPPDTTFTDRLVLRQGGRTIEVRHLGAGHTRGDVVVLLPAERIIAAGDLVIHPVPFVGSTSLPGEFGATLERLAALQPRVIVPGHGALLRDTRYLHRVAALLASVREQVGAAVARGETLEQARARVDLDAFRREFADGDAVRELLFTQYVQQSAIPAEYRRVTGR